MTLKQILDLVGNLDDAPAKTESGSAGSYVKTSRTLAKFEIILRSA
jgi:hypothetical protein